MHVREWDELLAEVARLEPPADVGGYVVRRAEQARTSTSSSRRTPPGAGVALRWTAVTVGVVVVLAGLALAAHSRRDDQTGSAPQVSEAKLAVLRQSEAHFARRYPSLSDAEAAVGFSLVRPQSRLASDANLDSVWASQTHEAVLIWKSGVFETIKPWGCHCDPTALRKMPHGFRYLNLNGWPATTAASNPDQRTFIGPESKAQEKYGVPASVEVVNNGLDITLYQYGRNVQPGLLAAADTLPKRPATALTITYQHNAFQHHKLVLLTGKPLFLSCDPTGGTIPDPAGACQSIQKNTARYVGKTTGGCIGGVIRWNVTITGVVDGNPVTRNYDMCANQARAWSALGGSTVPGVAG